MSRHWRPDMDAAVPLHGKRRRRHDWTSLHDYAPPRASPQAHEFRAASRAGLALVAAACVGVAVGAYALLTHPSAVDRLAMEAEGQ